VGEQEEVKEILDRPVRMVDMHRPDRGLSIPRLAQALMQGQRFIERHDDQESHGALEREQQRGVSFKDATHTRRMITLSGPKKANPSHPKIVAVCETYDRKINRTAIHYLLIHSLTQYLHQKSKNL